MALVGIYVAIGWEEFERLFTAADTRRLHSLGEVVLAGGGPRVTLPEGVADEHDVLVTSWSTAPMDPRCLVGERLRLAVHAAGSLRTLFPRRVLESGLRVSQGGSAAMALAVAEMTLTLTLVVLRNVHTHDRGLQRTRDWTAGGNGVLGRGIHSQRVGVVGLSRTGRHYLRMVGALGAKQLAAYDPYAHPSEAAALGVDLVKLDELCATSDVLAVCAPATPETHHLVGAEQLRLLHDGAVLVNTARSALVDEAALTAELVSGRLRAGLDVFDVEPLPSSSPLLGLPNVVLLPHVAGGTVDARFTQGSIVVSEIERYVTGAELEHEVCSDTYDRLA